MKLIPKKMLLAWRTAWYNNLTPGSYSAHLSWHPKGKIRGEIPTAIKDFLLGKTKVNPKWEKKFNESPELWGSFPNKTDVKTHADLRKEAYLIYQKIPHEERYIINTGRIDAHGNPIYTLNLRELPVENILEFISNISHGTAKSRLALDPANFGGNLTATKRTLGDRFMISIDDIFDVNPLNDPNRIAESLPSGLRKLLMKRSRNSPGSEFEYSYKLRKPFSKLKGFEIGKITGGKPFRSLTTFTGKIIKDNDYPIKEVVDVNKLREKFHLTVYDSTTDLMLDGIEDWGASMSEKEADEYLKLIKLEAMEIADTYTKGISDEELITRYGRRMTSSEYAQSTGEYNYPESWWHIEKNRKGGRLIPKNLFYIK